MAPLATATAESPGTAENPKTAESAACVVMAAEPADPARASGRRWWARIRPVDAMCVGGLVAQTVWASASVLLIPQLIGTDPVLLELLGATSPAMVAAGAFARAGKAGLVAALTAPTLGWVPLDAFGWWAGRRYGRSAVDLITRGHPRSVEFADRVDRLTGRWGFGALVLAPWLPVPNQLIYAATGWHGMSLLRFVIGDAIGTFLRTAAVVGLGYALGDDAVDLATAISHDTVLSFVALGVLLIAWTAFRHRRRLRGLGVRSRWWLAGGARRVRMQAAGHIPDIPDTPDVASAGPTTTPLAAGSPMAWERPPDGS
ncbi:DedA family protein [Frankia sp. Cas3]|uniref:DedA family protein n=1 Tax=Frankia sp. Cas3 TaxID=3073926 RepID=UPI002AD302E8|nr:VTT domain-containing protein [Frankia sp. Cas3]